VSLSREELIGIAHAERQRLGRTIQYAPAESWEAPSACAGWWNRDVMAHMSGQDTAAAHLFRGDPAEEIDAYRATLSPGQAFTVDGLNAFLVNNRSALPYRDVLTTWGQAAEAALEFAAAEPGQAQLLTLDALASNVEIAQRVLDANEHLASLLSAGRRISERAAALPQLTEKALIGAITAIVASRLMNDEADVLPELLPELLELTLIPYLGVEEAKRITGVPALRG